MKYLKKYNESFDIKSSILQSVKRIERNKLDDDNIINDIYKEMSKNCDNNFLTLIESSLTNFDINIYLSVPISNIDNKSSTYAAILKYKDNNFFKIDIKRIIRRSELLGNNYNYADILNFIKKKEIFYEIELVEKNLSMNYIDKIDKCIDIGEKGCVQVMKQKYSNYYTLRKVKGNNGVICSESSYDEIREKWYLNYRKYNLK